MTQGRVSRQILVTTLGSSMISDPSDRKHTATAGVELEGILLILDYHLHGCQNASFVGQGHCPNLVFPQTSWRSLWTWGTGVRRRTNQKMKKGPPIGSMCSVCGTT